VPGLAHLTSSTLLSTSRLSRASFQSIFCKKKEV
jgi:hypothetical protein